MDVIEGGRRTAVPRLSLVLAIIGLMVAAAAVVAIIASQQPSLVVNPSQPPEVSASPSLTAEASLEPSPKPSAEPSLEPTPARFVAGGSLTEGRLQQAATILSDVRVLITGGTPTSSGPGGLTSTEIWDPLTNQTTASGSLDPGMDHFLRTTERAFLLQDGRVFLVPGGCGCRPMPTGAAEIWDPTSGAWRVIDTLKLTRVSHSATLLADGRVLIAGGMPEVLSSAAKPLADAFIWDPVRETSTPTGSMIAARAQHLATLLHDGRVLMLGGTDESPGPEGLAANAEIWDPRTGTFSVVPSLSTVPGTPFDSTADPGSWAAITIRDGRVLIVNESSAILWDPDDESVTDAGSLVQPRIGGQTATLLADGRVLIVGGRLFQKGDLILEAELWDPETSTFEAAGTLSAPRTYHTTTALPDGRALIVGGFGGYHLPPLQTLEVWEPPRG
jgi:hypothetical protein